MKADDLTAEQRRRLLDRVTRDAVYYQRLVKRMEEQRWPRDDRVFVRAELAAQRLHDLRVYVELIGKSYASGAQ